MRLRVRPLERWDREETERRQSSPFRSTYAATLTLLERELRLIGAEQAVVQLDVSDRDCRLDGELRVGARVRSPRLRLAFDSEYGPLTYACDRFTHWQENLRAVALTLEALRRVERYGIATRGEQYTGWAALGSGIVTGQPLTRAEAAAIVIDLTALGIALGELKPMYSPSDLDDRGAPGAFLEDAFRAGARLHHPDRGGNEAAFAALTEAVEVLRGSVPA